MTEARRVSSEPTTPFAMRGTAYHEAGHAVAFLARGREIELVRLEEDATGEVVPVDSYSLNELSYGRADGSIPCRELETEIIVSYAGPAAEARLLGIEITPEGMIVPEGFESYSFGHRTDFQHVQDFAAREPTWRKPLQHKARLLRSAKWVTKRHWGAVEAIAMELLRERQVSGSRCRELFDSTG